MLPRPTPWCFTMNELGDVASDVPPIKAMDPRLDWAGWRGSLPRAALEAAKQKAHACI